VKYGERVLAPELDRLPYIASYGRPRYEPKRRDVWRREIVYDTATGQFYRLVHSGYRASYDPLVADMQYQGWGVYA
jgi:hypothetical protein